MSNPYWSTRPVPPPVFSDHDVPIDSMHMPAMVNPTKVVTYSDIAYGPPVNQIEPAVKALFEVWQWHRNIQEWIPDNLIKEIKRILLQHYTEDQLTGPQ